LKHRCRQFTYQDFKNFDYILVMDESNLRNVLALAKTEEEKNKVFKFRKFDHTVGGAPDVPDPYYGGVAGFEHVQDIVTRCSAGLLSFLQEEFPHAKIPDSENQDWMKEDELIMYDEEKEEQENDF
ncbi:MAG: hypothetical protein KDK36_00305, partial [Leptospiraceae bacterium]|nr:hypothetical protein [Leptospiraceae bacterium]